MNLKVKRLSESAVIPRYAKTGDSGFDLVATEDVIIEPGESAKVPTGLAFGIPDGHEIQIRPRSGITSNTKLRVQFGTVDQGYTGEVKVTVDNTIQPEIYEIDLNGKSVDYGMASFPETVEGTLSDDWDHYGHYTDVTYVIRKGDRICQAVLVPVAKATFEEVDYLDETERGEDGFGSTGTS